MKIILHLSFISLFVIVIGNASAQKVEDFQFKDITNTVRSYEELKGEHLTIIDFWTSYCKPCFKAMPYLEELHKEFADKGVVIIGVNSDGPRSTAKVAPLCKSLGISYPVLKDINSELMQTYQVSSLPTMLFVDADNNIVAVHEGFAGNDAEEIRAIIEKTLANQ